MASTRIVSIIGRKDAGKTTLMVALASELIRRGHRVMTIKHGHHPAEVDRSGSDSWRHLHEGGAERVLLAGPGLRVLFDRAPDEYDPVGLARRYLADADIVMVEGFKRAPIPKIEVHRRVTGPAPLLSADSPDAARWLAIVTDDLDLEASCRVIHFQDTMWMQLLATIAFDQAQVIEP
ncbi:MAG TPA: molybdopterin-guanine dinucleotide biosynthesis protein B [Gemmatimonadales bacterium]|nr:molybdopterin-guanine dinucleotide biosynthesis protein B [Gemmatimonadales bacterium]